VLKIKKSIYLIPLLSLMLNGCASSEHYEYDVDTGKETMVKDQNTFSSFIDNLFSSKSSHTDSSQKCDDPLIKGNLTTYDGEKIYHVPGDAYYDRTIAEEMFCTEDDAIKAGYRKSLR
jgi:hypothetical protein